MRDKLCLFVLLLSVYVAPAAAHHSYAMFDRSRELMLSGEVKAWEYSNPHAWLRLLVRTSDGKLINYGFEANPPLQLAKLGWRRNTLRPGDKVTVTYQPLRSGAAGGQLVRVQWADGTRLEAGLPAFTETTPGR